MKVIRTCTNITGSSRYRYRLLVRKIDSGKIPANATHRLFQAAQLFFLIYLNLKWRNMAVMVMAGQLRLRSLEMVTRQSTLVMTTVVIRVLPPPYNGGFFIQNRATKVARF